MWPGSLKSNPLRYNGHPVHIPAEPVVGYGPDDIGDGHIEQDTEAWLSAMSDSTRYVLFRAGTSPESRSSRPFPHVDGHTMIDRYGVSNVSKANLMIDINQLCTAQIGTE